MFIIAAAAYHFMTNIFLLLLSTDMNFMFFHNLDGLLFICDCLWPTWNNSMCRGLSANGNEPIWANKGIFIGSFISHVVNFLKDFSYLKTCVLQPDLVEPLSLCISWHLLADKIPLAIFGQLAFPRRDSSRHSEGRPWMENNTIKILQPCWSSHEWPDWRRSQGNSK